MDGCLSNNSINLRRTLDIPGIVISQGHSNQAFGRTELGMLTLRGPPQMQRHSGPIKVRVRDCDLKVEFVNLISFTILLQHNLREKASLTQYCMARGHYISSSNPLILPSPLARTASTYRVSELRHSSMMSSHHKQTKPHEKHPKFGHLPLSTSGPQDCALSGSALLNTPYFNKGAAFPAEERKRFKLTGLLPQNVQTLDHQVKRAYQQYSSRQDALAKNTFMTSLAEQNQVLYFRVS